MAEQAGSASAQVVIEWLPPAGMIDIQGQGNVVGLLEQHLHIRMPAESNCWLSSPRDEQNMVTSVPVEPGKLGEPTEPDEPAKAGNKELEPSPIRACWLSPNHWMLFVPFRQDSRWVEAIETTCPDAVATCVGDAFCGVRLAGPGTVGLLAQGCPLDLDRLSAGSCARTLVARCSVLLLATANADAEFELWVDRSYRNYLHNWLVSACAAQGIRVPMAS